MGGMQDEYGLLLSIAAEPEDEVARLAYADLMEEQGNLPRAEFIRLQCELARDERDRHLGALRRAELKEREAELLEEHQAQWAGDAVGCNPQFRRGFLERVTLGADNVPRCAQQFKALREAMPTIAGLKLEPLNDRMGAHGIGNLLSRDAFDGLRELDLADVCCGNEVADVVARADKLALERLNMNGCFLDANGLAALGRSEHLGRLRELNLGENDLAGGWPVFANLRAFPQLETLELDNSDIGSLEIEHLAFSPFMRHLKRLSLNDVNVANALAALTNPECTFRLRDLEMRRCHFAPGGMSRLAASAQFCDLESLLLAGNELDRQDAQMLAESPHLGKLETLGMSGTFIGSEGVKALIESKQLGGLRNLYLLGLRDEQGIPGTVPPDTASIASLPGLGRLHCLDLQQNAIDAEGFAALLASPHLGQVRELDMSGNPVGADGARALAATDRLPNLRRLGLNMCRLGEEGLSIVAQTTGLRALQKLEIDLNDGASSRFAMQDMESAVVGAVGPMPMTLAERAGLQRIDPRHVRVRE